MEIIRNQASEAALLKVEDIYKARFYSHAFTRFGPLTIESKVDLGEIALIDPKQINPNLDRLNSIFCYGLVAKNFAERIGLPYSSNFTDPSNQDAVSLTVPDCRLSQHMSFGINAAAKWDQEIKIPAKNILLLLVSPLVQVEPYKWPEERHSPFEVLKKRRVSQEAFGGIVIIDGSSTPDASEYGLPCQQNIDWSNLDPENAAMEIAEAMLLSKPYREKPGLALPIYGCSGNLYWPRKIEYKQLVKP